MPRKRTERKRRVHTRSRNGCFTCKAKHLRCDEQKPLCGRCLANGGPCGYTDLNAPYSPPCQEDQVIIKEENCFDDLSSDLSCLTVPNHLFVGYPIEMTYESRVLFDLFAQYRGVFSRDVSPESHSFLVEKALSSPALLHSALVCSAIRWTWFFGPMGNLHKSFLHHQLEAIKYVNDALQNPLTAMRDSTISSIASLAMVESGLGRQEIADAHLNGLSQILALRTPQVSEGHSLLQSMIYSSSQGVYQLTIREIYEISQMAGAGASALVASSGMLNTFQAFVAPYIQKFLEHPGIGSKTLADLVVNKTQRSDSVCPNEAESRSRFSSCCFYLWTILGAGDTDMLLLNWFVEALIDDLDITEQSMLQGDFPRHAWLWGAMLARVAGTSARLKCSLEAQLAAEWKDITSEKIRLVSQSLQISTWDEAKAVLKSFVWRDTSLNERALQHMWEEAVLGADMTTNGIL